MPALDACAGVTQVLALVLKAGQRARLLPLARELWPAASRLLSSEAAANSVLTRWGGMCIVTGVIVRPHTLLVIHVLAQHGPWRFPSAAWLFWLMGRPHAATCWEAACAHLL